MNRAVPNLPMTCLMPFRRDAVWAVIVSLEAL